MKLLRKLAAISASKHVSSMPIPVFLPLVSIFAFLVINYFFCPRFVLWQALEIPPAHSTPEVNRAVATLLQIQQPFKAIEDPSNSVIQWRLLFPLLAHYLAIPRVVYLAIPHFGCLLTLGWIAKLTLDRTGSRKLTLVALILFGTTSWFFVSTGWLAYFDSWYMLGILLASFHPSRSVLVACCLLMPWIDERFVVSLPLAMVVREIHFERPFSPSNRSFLFDFLATVLTIVPWIAFRIAMTSVVKDHSPIASSWGVPLEQDGMLWKVIDGWWNGLRGVWIYLILFYVLSLARGKTATTLLLMVVTAITLVLNLRLAGDISRTIANLLPVALLGFFETIRTPLESFSKDAWKKCLCGLAAFNLFFPANHVVTVFKTPILNWAFEKYHYQNPPADVNATNYERLGVEAWNSNRKDHAIEFFTLAIKLDPRSASSHLYRAAAALNLNNIQSAESDIRRALEIAPQMLEAQFRLAQLHVLKGENVDAVPVLQKLLNNPIPAELRAEAEKLLQSISTR